MNEPDFWTRNAEAMEMSIEGNRLIAQEIGELAADWWHRTIHALDDLIRGNRQHRHLPPV